MEGKYWKLKGQEATITKMEEVIGQEKTEELYCYFFYDLPDFFWEGQENEGDERLKSVVDYLWGYSLKKNYDLYNIQSFKDFGEDWLDCYDCMQKDLEGAFFNPMLSWLLYDTSVEQEVYAFFDGDESLYSKMETEFEDEEAFDVCMWWFIMGVAYAASGLFKRKYEGLKKMYESREWKDNLANYEVGYIPFEDARAEAIGWAFKDTYEQYRRERT